MPWLPVVGLAAVKVAVAMVFAGRYGWHRDELYYLASARYVELGYVDYPPVTPAIARLVQVIAPDSVVTLRFTSLLARALVVVLGALIARELGGGRRAQVLAALAVVISQMFVGGNFIFETVSFDQLVWALLIWLVARVLAGRDPRLWLLVGLGLGIGLETKYTVAGLAVALAAGLLLTPARRHLATPWPWLGAALAVVVLVPNLWWQAGHGWDSVAYTLHHRGSTDGPVAYWLEQALFLVNPLLLPLVVAGAVWMWRSGTFRALGWTAILVELVLFAAGGKSYYPAPVYPLLYAAGAVWLERSVGSRLLRRAWVAAAVVTNLVLVPILLPVLPADVVVRTGLVKVPTLAEMYGWPDLAHQVAAAYASLPPSDPAGGDGPGVELRRGRRARPLRPRARPAPRGQPPPDLLLLGAGPDESRHRDRGRLPAAGPGAALRGRHPGRGDQQLVWRRQPGGGDADLRMPGASTAAVAGVAVAQAPGLRAGPVPGAARASRFDRLSLEAPHRRRQQRRGDRSMS